MTASLSDHRRFMHAAEAAYAAEQSKMTALTQRELRLRNQLASLSEARKSRTAPLETDAASRAGAAFLWQRWVDTRVTALNAELARVLVQKSRQHGSLTRAFGKYQVCAHLFEQARIDKIKRLDKIEEIEALSARNFLPDDI